MSGMGRQYFLSPQICSWKQMPPYWDGEHDAEICNPEAVDQQGAIHAHKLPGALGGSVHGENICQTEAEPLHSPTNGQHNCCGIYQQWEAHIQAPHQTWHAASGNGTFRRASHCLQSTSQESTTQQRMPNPEPFIPQPNGSCFLQSSGGSTPYSVPARWTSLLPG